MSRVWSAVLALGLVACGAASGNQDAGVDAGSLFTGGGGGTTGGGSGGGTGGGGGGSSFAGDTCDTQRTITLTAMGTDYVGNAISDNSLATPTVTPSCAQRSRDVVFKIITPIAGSLHVTVTPHGTGGNLHLDPVVSLFEGATCAAAVSTACSDSGAIDASETVIKQVAAGPLWVWISSADPTESGAEFDVSVLLD